MLVKNICWFSDRKQCITQSHQLFRNRSLPPLVLKSLFSVCGPLFALWSSVMWVTHVHDSLLPHNAGHNTAVTIKASFARSVLYSVIIQAQEGFMRCFPFKEICLSLSLYGFYSTPNPLLTARSVAQTSLRLKQSDPNSSLALSSHTAMICKLITTLDQTASESATSYHFIFFPERGV